MRKDLAVVTMVYDDEDYLKIWLNYWREQLAEEQLYVLVHGGNAELEAMAAGTNVIVVPRPEPYPEMEEDRWKMLSNFVSGLLMDYKVAVYTDVDEILVADPAYGKSIAACLAGAKAPANHAAGVEVIHRGDLEPAIDLTKPVLSQRSYFRTNSFHSKPSIVTQAVRWGRGGHFQERPNVRFVPGVVCFHLRFYDEEIFLQRAERRRNTTKAPEGLDQLPNRRWRSSTDAAQVLLKSLRDTPIVGYGTLAISWMRLKVRYRKVPQTDPNGLYLYPCYAPNRLHSIPKRFRGIF